MITSVQGRLGAQEMRDVIGQQERVPLAHLERHHCIDLEVAIVPAPLAALSSLCAQMPAAYENDACVHVMRAASWKH